MNFLDICQRLEREFPEAIVERNEENVDPYIVVQPETLVSIMRYLKEDSELRFDYLACISGVDYPEEGVIEVVYHVFSYEKGHRLVLKVRLP